MVINQIPGFKMSVLANSFICLAATRTLKP